MSRRWLGRATHGVLLALLLLTGCHGSPDRASADMGWVQVNAAGDGFVVGEDDKPFRVWGVNYDHDRDNRLLEDYWAEEWPTVVEDFAEMKALGANVVRVHLQVAAFMDGPREPNAAALRRLGMLAALAEETGLYLDVTGLACYRKTDVPAWYDALDEQERWETQAEFWRAVARVCRDSPAVFCYDLMNEPLMLGGGGDAGDWLPGAFGDRYFAQRIALDLDGRSREELARQWVSHLVAAIHEVDDRHLITVGVIPWAFHFKGAKPLFHGETVGAGLDFVAVHVYPDGGDIAATIETLRVYDVGKPLIVEEIFPLNCTPHDLTEFVTGTRGFCDGWVGFYWGQTLDECEQEGTMRAALMAGWLRWFMGAGRDAAQLPRP